MSGTSASAAHDHAAVEPSPAGGPAPIDRILLVEVMGGLGDLVLALPVVEALARSHPHAELHVAAGAPWHELLEGDPRIASVTPVPALDDGTVGRVVGELLDGIRPDLAITTSRLYGLPALLESASPRAVTNLWRSPPADELVDERYVRLLVADGVTDAGAPPLPRVLLRDAELAGGRDALRALVGPARPVLLFPDSGMRVKHWPEIRWRALVADLLAAGGAPVVVSQVAEQEAALAAAGAVVASRMALRALAAFCAAAAEAGGSAVGGDTGPVRLATAAGLRAVGLYGPTLGSRYGLRPDLGVDLQGLAGCRIRTPTAITEQSCWWHAECPLTGGGAPACMADIRVDDVTAALGRLRRECAAPRAS